MRTASVVLFSPLCFFGHCWAATTRAAEAPRKGALLAKLTPDEKKAVELARAFLARKKVKWGEPARISRASKGQGELVGGEKGAFLISYLTPVKESYLLGQRMVVVNIATRKVAFIPRE
jgi:hypothetical protein